jgi:proteic killer suppression protein
MDIEYTDSELQKLETESCNDGRWPQGIPKAFRKVIAFIRAALDERDFRSMRSLNFEKLKGDRSADCSFRLNDQWRLIVEVKEADPKNAIIVKKIEDYH